VQAHCFQLPVSILTSEQMKHRLRILNSNRSSQTKPPSICPSFYPVNLELIALGMDGTGKTFR